MEDASNPPSKLFYDYLNINNPLNDPQGVYVTKNVRKESPKIAHFEQLCLHNFCMGLLWWLKLPIFSLVFLVHQHIL